MRIVTKIKTMQNLGLKLRSEGKSVGFVPTMGALHLGHLSLVSKSKKENDITILSVFVNPLQFGANEDFKGYPRPEKKDILLSKQKKVDIIFYPSPEEMYPRRYLTNINVKQIDQPLCGRSRPGHFKGVTTVVGKLLNIVLPERIYLGQKDAQQVVILKKMIKDLNFPVTVKVGKIIREKNGLAISSRNSYLSATQIKEATVLYQSLKKAKQKILEGERNPKKIAASMKSLINLKSSGTIEYIECINAQTLEAVKILKGTILIALAVKFGRARLIDNITVRIP